MLKIKKVIPIILILIIILSLMPLKAMAVNGDIKDYNDISTLESKYGYGQLVSTDDTKIEIIESNSTLYKDAEDDHFRCYGLYRNDTLKLRITNCSIDKQGRICDVVIKVDNICPYSFLNKGGYSTNIFENANEYIYAYLQICLKYNNSNVIALWLNTNSASVDFNMTYYLAGTTTKADIDYNTSMFGDLDAQGNNFTAGDEEKGNEFVKLLDNDGTFYYHKDYYMDETQTGIGIVAPRDINTSTGISKNEFNNKRQTEMGNTNSYDLWSSTFLLQDLKDSQYSFHYGGYSCGILYTFISPYTYKLTNPTKTVSKNIVKKNEKFYYEISQYIPNNYWSEILSFVNNSGGLFSSVEISDKLDKNLKIAGDIEVRTSDNGKNVTDYFDITTKNNAVRVSAKEEYLKSAYFYSQIYYVKVPVVIDDECDIKSVSNEATTTIVDKNESRVLTSSEVTTMIENTVTVNTEIDNGTISEQSIKKVKNGDGTSYKVEFQTYYGYELESVTIDGKQVSKEDLKSENNTYSYNFIDKQVTQDIVHNIVVKTKLRDTKVIANYIDEKGVRIETSEEINGKVFDKYTTNEKNIKYYTLKEKPSNETGEMSEDTIVINYIYTRNKNNVIINYLEDETNKELAESVKKILDQGSRYNLKEETSKDIEYYSINIIDGKVKGIIEDDMIINVYYKRNKRNIIINFLDYMTKKVIAPLILKTQEQGTDYDVISEIAPNILYYTYKDTTGNTKGLLLENETINSYYIRNKNNITIKYLEEKTEKELDKIVSLTLEQGTDYNVTKIANKDIPCYKITNIKGDTKGFITDDKEIIVYYDLKDTEVQVNYINEEGKVLAKSEKIKGKIRR